MILQKLGNLAIFTSPLLSSHPEIVHGFSTRIGGISQGPYQSLNLCRTVGDSPDAVRENRRRWYETLNVDESVNFNPRQVLESEILVGPPFPEAPADGVLTHARGQTLMTQSADCVLILLYDPVKHAVGNLHASWRGTLGEIARKGVSLMTQHFDSNAQDILAVLCPSIGPCCYEVKEDVIRPFTDRHPYSERFITRRDGKTFLDLWETNRWQLTDRGIRKEHIDLAALCTRCHPEWFYSYRRDGARTGRCAALIGLR